MKKLLGNIRLVFSGDTVLLVLSVILFFASVANATQWSLLRNFRYCGICTLLLSLTFLLLICMELVKHERQKRTILAALFFLAATLISLSGGHFVIEHVHGSTVAM